jgi:RimJ/RimL family protein N-acetyltransferase
MESELVPQVIDDETGLPIGPIVEGPGRAGSVDVASLAGRYCRLERLVAVAHSDSLYVASTPADAAARFLYLPVPPHSGRADFDVWMERSVASTDPLYFAVVDIESGDVVGRQSYLRIDPGNRSIEIGDIYWGPAMSRTRVATEALFLFACHAFDELSYRRFEWKCNALNAPSVRAALRFGFTYEGTFRRAAIVKGRSRDTAWFSMIADEWPAIRAEYVRWLDPANFDAAGQQLTPLATRRG